MDYRPGRFDGRLIPRQQPNQTKRRRACSGRNRTPPATLAGCSPLLQCRPAGTDKRRSRAGRCIGTCQTWEPRAYFYSRPPAVVTDAATARLGCHERNRPRLRPAGRSSCRLCTRPSRSAAGDCVRGKGIARPEQPREPRQSWRAQARRAWMWAIATAPALLGARFRASKITSRVGTDRTEGPLRPRSPGCPLARRSGHLVPAGIRALPYRPLRKRIPACRNASALAGRSACRRAAHGRPSKRLTASPPALLAHMEGGAAS